jgi:hypothetical protein
LKVLREGIDIQEQVVLDNLLFDTGSTFALASNTGSSTNGRLIHVLLFEWRYMFSLISFDVLDLLQHQCYVNTWRVGHKYYSLTLDSSQEINVLVC